MKYLFLLFVCSGVLAASVTETPYIGGVDTDSAVVNFRTSSSASVVVDYSTTNSFTTYSSTSSYTTVSANDYTAMMDLTGLSANTTYYYRVEVDGVVQSFNKIPKFKTFPSSGSFNVAVVADTANNLSKSPAPYKKLKNHSPLFVIQGGDFTHQTKTTLSDRRNLRRDLRDTTNTHGQVWWNHVTWQYPLVHMWDDHDYCGNDEDRLCSTRSNAWQVYKEYYPHYPLANASNGLWHSFEVADAEFFILDLRSQRDPGADTDNANKSMLDGALISNDQKDWLFDGIRDSSATWKIIWSSVTFNEDARPSSIDLWHNYSTEAAELKDWIDGTGHAHSAIDGVIVLSADIHTGGGIDDGTNSLIGVPEMTIPHTNLNGGNNNNKGTWSEGVTNGKNGGNGYSTLLVSGASVVLSVYSSAGALRHTYTVN